MDVSIIGSTGYGGMELVRILHKHPNIRIASLHSDSAAGKRLSEIYPHIGSSSDMVLRPVESDWIIAHSDLVILATPSGVSSRLAQVFVDRNHPIIDLSGDFRFTDEALYERWYKKQSAPCRYLKQFTYQLPEFFKSEMDRPFISNPGCYATCVLLGLAPLVQQQLIEENIIIDAKSGLSGAGKSLSHSSHFVNAHDNMTLYKANQHQHIPEITQQLTAWSGMYDTVQFSTSLIPVSRGIFCTMYVQLKDRDKAGMLHELYQAVYKEKPFVRVQPDGQLPDLKQVAGSNYCDIGLVYNKKTNVVTIVSVIDNLIKGAAGQAVQNLNLFAGYPEASGLDLVAPYF
ncbi:N-acetyl-gamma-glutamyl-phosphate reductase [Vagococcus acidifermentans]|uniref:N-acetyl-gamma-glutamyl-phosphate reductase n=1 Tax=Vagococcus acidifermentans TaxID=564710 RepID=A0A430AXZ6_9ENTE|nr:N-acetyl-gamma-glutamyl-phosphate reductase [Vagococcus acidifermentans]RSU12918.1 N-acetyl-gamma-glutamyl-phosphate reductase [Vagococcus acidifermentans]